jgi:acyl-CoA thioester hydrolase
LTQASEAAGVVPSVRGFTHGHRIRVRYAETDAMGVVYYANYLTYFEVARVEYLRAAGVSYRALEDDGLVAAVISAHVDYRLPARFDDELSLLVRYIPAGRVRFRFEYEVWREADGALIVGGHTEHAMLSKETLRPVRMPDWVLERAERFEASRR